MTFSMPEQPRVRPIEIVPFEQGGRRSFLLQDPAGHFDSTLELSPAALVLVGLCDGSRTADRVRADFERRTGQRLPARQLEEFLGMLDSARLLDSPSFARHRARAEREFDRLRWRPAAHAGSAYPAAAGELSESLDAWLAACPAGGRPGGRLRALIAPHIDFHRGGPGYGRAYAALVGREAPEVVVLIGTGHAAEEGRFILADKGFRTPLGDLPADRDFIDRLERRLPRDHRRGRLAHRREHSIEFQAVWLARVFRGSLPAVVPILATSFDDLMSPRGGPLRLSEVADFLEALRETLREERRRALVVAGADLAHVGPRFGDEEPASARFLEAVRARDLAALEAARSGSAARFFARVAEHRNRDRICGVAAIYAALHVVEADGGDLLDYRQAVDPSEQLAVTFAGVALYGEDGGPGLARAGAGPGHRAPARSRATSRGRRGG